MFITVHLFHGGNVFEREAPSDKAEESLLKTAFSLENESTVECLWATVEEQAHGFWLESPELPATVLFHRIHFHLVLDTVHLFLTQR